MLLEPASKHWHQSTVNYKPQLKKTQNPTPATSPAHGLFGADVIYILNGWELSDTFPFATTSLAGRFRPRERPASPLCPTVGALFFINMQWRDIMPDTTANTATKPTKKGESTNLPGEDYNPHHIDVRWWSWKEAHVECWRLGLRISMSRLMFYGQKKKAFRCGKAAGAKSRLYPVDRWSLQAWTKGKTEAPNDADQCEKVRASQ